MNVEEIQNGWSLTVDNPVEDVMMVRWKLILFVSILFFIFWGVDSNDNKISSWRELNTICYWAGSCKNLYDDKKCIYWAKERECFKNPIWMRKNCAESCNSCEELDGSDDDGGDDDTRDNDVDRKNEDEVEIHVNDGQPTTRGPRQEFEDDEDGLGFFCYFVQFIFSYASYPLFIILILANSDQHLQMANKRW